MSAIISLTETGVFTALVSALGTFGMVSAVGAPIPIIRGQVNRVPEPQALDYLVMWPLMRTRIATNIDTYTDTIVTGSITLTVLTVTNVASGAVAIGQAIYGTGIASNTSVVAQLTGPAGGVGTYTITPSQTISAETLYLGTEAITQATEIVIQCDIHGPSSADNAARLATLWRDQFGCEAFQAINAPVTPLYVDDPKQIPFENGEQQTEERWVVDLHMQANIAITTAQQFADQLIIPTVAVQAAYPA